MLRPLLFTFITAYFVDWLVGVALLEAAYLVLLVFWAGNIQTDSWQFWVQLFVGQVPVGLLLALACRLVQDRRRSSLLVLTTHVSPDWMFTTMVSAVLVAETLLYPIELTNTGNQSLQTPFSAGTMLFWACAVVTLLVAEGIAYALELDRAKFRLGGLYPLCAIVITGIVCVDMIAFKQGYTLVAIVAALMLPPIALKQCYGLVPNVLR